MMHLKSYISFNFTILRWWLFNISSYLIFWIFINIFPVFSNVLSEVNSFIIFLILLKIFFMNLCANLSGCSFNLKLITFNFVIIILLLPGLFSNQSEITSLVSIVTVFLFVNVFNLVCICLVLNKFKLTKNIPILIYGLEKENKYLKALIKKNSYYSIVNKSEICSPYELNKFLNKNINFHYIVCTKEEINEDEIDSIKLILKSSSSIALFRSYMNENKNFMGKMIFFGSKYYFISSKNIKYKPCQILIKRFFDFLISLIGIIVLSPLFLIVSLLVKIDSSGPIFYLQKRNGIYADEFDMFKFRSMYVDDDIFIQASKNDKRITRVGKILRSTSLDELPQLINVLIGSMSLVGPRPHAVQHNKEYYELIDFYAERHLCKPGITGLAQINGLRGEAGLEMMTRRVVLDIKYIENWSLLGDLIILFKTPFSLFRYRAY